MVYDQIINSNQNTIPNNTYLFNLCTFLLSSDFISVNIGIQILMIKLLQMLSCAFNPLFISVWKESKLVKIALELLDAFRLICFTQNNSTVYLIFLYLGVFYMFVFAALILYSALLITHNSFSLLWPLKILKTMTVLTSGPLFIPLLSKNICIDIKFTLGMFISVFNCPMGVNNYCDGSECFSGVFIVHLIFGIVSLITLIYIVFIYTLYCYDIRYNTLSFNAKFSSFEDMIFLFEQILFVLIREILRKDDLAILAYFIISVFVCLLFYNRNPYYHPIAKRFNLLLHLLVLWSIISLAIGKILMTIIGFSPILLLIFGYVIIIPSTLINSHDIYDILKDKSTKGESYLKRIMLYLDLVKNHKLDRTKEILLDTFIALIESECISSNCPLRKYINNASNSGQNSEFNEIYLLQYAETLFIEGIKKNPFYNTLRIYYSIFLYEKLNKKHKAKLQLLLAESISSESSYYDRYLIDKTRKSIEPSALEFSLDELSNKFAFVTHKQELIDQIRKASFLYIHFWSILYASTTENNVNITQLNKIGSSITSLISSINIHFAIIQEVNPNDYSTLKHYCDFLIELLNNNHKAEKYQEAIEILSKENDSIEKDNIVNVDLNTLTRSDKIQFIITTMNQDSSFIQAMSFGICEALGYTKKELIGQPIDGIIPEMFRKRHRLLLQKTIEDFKKQAIEFHMTSKQLKTFPTFCLNKMKYLIPVSLSTGIIPNEVDEYYHITRIVIDESIFVRNDICYVMTRMNKTIYSFSSTAVPLLNLNSSDMDNNDFEIFDFISDGNSKGNLGLPGAKKPCLSFKDNIEQVKDVVWEKIVKGVKGNRSVKRFNTIIMKDNSKDKEGITKSTARQFSIEGKILIILEEKVALIFKMTLKKAQQETFMQNSAIMSQGMGINNNSINAHMNTNSNSNFNKDFIPINQDQLYFQYDKLAYTITAQKPYELLNQLKNDANKHFTQSYSKSKQSSSSSLNSQSYSSSFSLNSSNGNSSINDNSQSKPLLFAIRKSIQPKEEYYKPNLSLIKYYVYNYQKKTFETVPFELQSQVEVKMTEVLTKYESGPKADINNSKSDINPLSSTKGKYDQLGTNAANSSKTKLKESTLKNQLVFALSKYETHYEITLLKLMSFISVILVIIEAIVFLLIYNELVLNIKGSITLVSDSYSLLLNIIICIYLVRELSLVSNEKYVITYMSIEQYRLEIHDDLLAYFFKCETILNRIMNAQIWISVENFDSLYKSTIKVYMIREDLMVDSLNITLFGLLSNELDSMHDICQSTRKDLLPNQNRVYSFIINGLNGINEGIKHQSSIFINEMATAIVNVKVKSWIIFSVCFIITIPIFAFINHIYIKVAEKKKAYLNIFFEIDREIIIVSLHRCEKFNLKLMSKCGNKDPLSSDFVCNDYDDDIDYDFDNEQDSQYNNCSGNDINGRTKSSLADSKRVKSELKQKQKQICSKEQAFVMSFLFIFLDLILIIQLIIIGLIYSVLTASYHSIEVFDKDNILQARYLTIFNIFREYMFDSSIDILYHPLSTYIEDVFSSIYALQQEEKEIQNEFIEYCPSKYFEVRNIINNMNICEFQKELFKDHLSDSFNCTHVTYGAGDLGMTILLSWYLEEIKTIKNLFINNVEEVESKGFKYNMTLWGLDAYDELVPPEDNQKELYFKLHPINFFNHPTHDNLVILFRYILLPVFLYKNNAMIEGIMEDLDKFKLTYQVLLYTICVVIVVVYLFSWKRVENSLNEIIYKSKNMLTIIPIEVLVNLKSVQKLFKLNTNITND